VFRKRKITPLVGDFVKFTIDQRNKGYIKEVKDRKNELSRPPVANIEQAIIVSSAAEPAFSQLLLDRFLVSVEANQIKPIILISKIDLIPDSQQTFFTKLKKSYEQIGYPTKLVSIFNQKSLSSLCSFIENKVSVIAGQSGVGKSSILNGLDQTLQIETGEISQSLGRGKHTTRHVELIEMCDGLVADTPGFSSLEFTTLEQEDLTDCFPEFKNVKSNCRFRGCLHDKEPHCAVKALAETKDFFQQRYEHYLKFLQEIQSRKPRY